MIAVPIPRANDEVIDTVTVEENKNFLDYPDLINLVSPPDSQS